MRLLLSVPPAALAGQSSLKRLLHSQPHEMFFACDPEGSRLGSGAGTAWLLSECYHFEQRENKLRNKDIFQHWLSREPRIIVHSGGQSRRLPSYGPGGKVMMPIPVFRWSRGQRCDQTLLDMQLPLYEEVMQRAPSHLRTLVSCGDVLILHNRPLPPVPEDADVVCYGIRQDVDQLRKHGVFFMNRDTPEDLETMLQKPSLKDIQKYSLSQDCVMDVGLWLLSDRAVTVLCERSKAVGSGGMSDDDFCLQEYDLYTDFGLALGQNPIRHDSLVQQLRVKIVTLQDARFFHYGTTTDLISSTAAIQNTLWDSDDFLRATVFQKPTIFCQNACIQIRFTEEQRDIWIENSDVSVGWSIQCHSVITGVPKNKWKLQVPANICIDVVPILRNGGDVQGWVARPYGFHDSFRGLITDENTEFLGMPLAVWLKEHGVSCDALVHDNEKNKAVDIQFALLFPWCASVEDLGFVIRWMISSTPHDMELNDKARAKRLWEMSPRYSANSLNDYAYIPKLLESRKAFQMETLPILAANASRSPFYQLDLNYTAQEYVAAYLPLPKKLLADEAPIMRRIHHHMFRARVLQYLLILCEGTSVCNSFTKEERNHASEGLPFPLQGIFLSLGELRSVYGIRSKEELIAFAHEEETTSFELLRTAIMQQLITSGTRPSPKLSVYNDQIVWARGPVRIDLSGGWTDTPPYTNLCGGNVVNVAIELNGQLPLQVYVKLSPYPEIIIRSVDLGSVEKLSTYDELRLYDVVGSPFSIPKAALALAGFLPEFGATSFATLREQLQNAFSGKGLEITLLVAVPAGSGLGTSSLVAATVLTALSDFCGLGWDVQEVGRRTLCLEQLLTTGGGWQDQYGGLYRGLKLLQTKPGFEQIPCVRWLPEHLLEDPRYARCHLLYYTGITRTSKVILADIVRGMFMNSAKHLRVLTEMRQQALDLHEAIMRGDFERYGRLIGEAWEQNKRLDSGTCTPAIAEIISRVEANVWGLKLAGAGGGGYLYMVAKDVDAAQRIRQELTERPPNALARFVEMRVSHNGIQVSRS